MKLFKIFLKFGVFFFALILIINLYIIFKAQSSIVNENVLLEKEKKVDVIVVLGAGVYSDRPSYILMERLEQGISLYKNGVATKIIMTGDHGRKHYNEVQVMKDYAIKKGVPSADIFMDHAGFSTYESMVRLKKIFQAETAIIISQKYHLPRAIYLAERLDIDALGVSADRIKYKGQWYRSTREFVARFKDFFIGIFKPKWYIGGEAIPLNQSGDITND